MTIGFLSTDYNGRFPYIVPAGCSYYRCLLPMTVAGRKARMGMPAWDAKKGFGIKESETSGVFGFTTIVLKLVMARSTPHQIGLAQRLGQYIIVDIDDYHEGLTPANKAYEATHPELNKRANRAYYEQTILAADMVTVSTPFLYDIYSQRHPNVHMIRNAINPTQFQRHPVTNRKPVIGWGGAVNFRNNDLEQLRDWLPDLLEEHDLYFHHAGHDPSAPSFTDITGIPHYRLTTSPLVPIHQYADGLKFDIGLVPLNDIPFNHAKSNIKGLEYAATGIPFVASDLPEYRVLHEDGVGRLARTAEEWAAQVTGLLDYKTRKREAAISHNITVKKWEIEARRSEWEALFAQTPG